MIRMPRRVRLHKTSGWNRIEIEDFDCPPPLADQIKIDVRIAGVNVADTVLAQGFFALEKQRVGWPMTPGFEVAGLISEVGEGVTDMVVGDKVFGFSFFGGYSTQVVEDASYMRRMPDGMEFAEGASATLAFVFAYYAVHKLAQPHKRTALVYAATDDFGLALLQILKDDGYSVMGVVRNSEQVEMAERYRADIVMLMGDESLGASIKEFAPKGYDLIFDLRSSVPLVRHVERLTRQGRAFIFEQQPPVIDPQTGQRKDFASIASMYHKPPFWFKWFRRAKPPVPIDVSTLFEKRNFITDFYSYIIPKFEKRVLYVPPMTKFDYHKVADAFEATQSPNTIGKVVLTFDD